MKKFKIKSKFWLFFSGLVIMFCAVGTAYSANKLVKNTPLQNYFIKSNTSRSVWDWSGVIKRDNNTLKQTARQLRLRQVNMVFVDISGLSGPLDTKNQAAINEFDQKLANYVDIMASEDIVVYGAAGDVIWSQPLQQQIPLNLQNHVFDYNQKYPKQALKGLEFDIESYNQKGFAEASSEAKSVVLTDFLDMVKKLRSNQQLLALKSNSAGSFDLGFAIPYWYDNENKNIPSVNWSGKTGPVLYHLMDELNQLPSSNIVVMAYRNAANGNDGTIAHSRTEIGYAQAKAPKVGVFIGQETTDVEPAKITFYGQSLLDFSQEMNAITDQFKSTGVYRGIAINDLQGTLELKNRQY